MKIENLIFIGCFSTIAVAAYFTGVSDNKVVLSKPMEKACVFKSLMGEQPVDNYAQYKDEKSIQETIQKGESWLIQAQNKDGGWGAGSHSNQGEMNPHAVSSDPATTAMSAMALYRLGYSIESGIHKENLKRALEFLLVQVESSKNKPRITDLQGTQIQVKLGQNIDAALTLQFFNQIVETIKEDKLKKRVENAIQICVDKVEKSFDSSGKVSGAGWAGVLQSSFATSGLEKAAKLKNIKVDTNKIEASRKYQKENFDTDSNRAKTDDGAGVVLYAVSSSVRNSAEEAHEAEQIFEKAKKEGKISQTAEMNQENMERIGIAKDKARKYTTATKVYKAAKVQALNDNVMNGFGNNGGEEFLSFLQTGESLVVKKDSDWKKWYDNVSGKMIKIQNANGSWNGHHCITSPVFCTATSLLILSVENDFDKLQKK